MQSISYQIEGLTPNDDETENSRKKNRYVPRPKNTVEGNINQESNESVVDKAERKSSGCRSCNKKR